MPLRSEVSVQFAFGKLMRLAAFFLLAVGAGTSQAWGQIRFNVDPKASLAWWEINPNLSHLWATTCPQDPAWQPGEGRSVGYMVDYVQKNRATATHMSDTARIPIYPRKVVRSLCTPAVTGEVTTTDTVTWGGTRGFVSIKADKLITGLDYRDEYAQKAIYGTDKYPDIRFQIDSLVNIHKVKGDTLRADVVGSFEFRGVRTPLVIPVTARPAGGGIRVEGKTHVPASYLTEQYGISKMALGLSVGLKIWKELFMGIDVILRPATTGS